MKGECSMTALEASRLIDWLKAHGHTGDGEPREESRPSVLEPLIERLLKEE